MRAYEFKTSKFLVNTIHTLQTNLYIQLNFDNCLSLTDKQIRNSFSTFQSVQGNKLHIIMDQKFHL